MHGGWMQAFCPEQERPRLGGGCCSGQFNLASRTCTMSHCSRISDTVLSLITHDCTCSLKGALYLRAVRGSSGTREGQHPGKPVSLHIVE